MRPFILYACIIFFLRWDYCMQETRESKKIYVSVCWVVFFLSRSQVIKAFMYQKHMDWSTNTIFSPIFFLLLLEMKKREREKKRNEFMLRQKRYGTNTSEKKSNTILNQHINIESYAKIKWALLECKWAKPLYSRKKLFKKMEHRPYFDDVIKFALQNIECPT